MEILIGIVLVLLAFKLIAELAGFFIGMFVGAKIAKMDIFNEDKDMTSSMRIYMLFVLVMIVIIII